MKTAYTMGDDTRTVAEWARDPRCVVAEDVLRRRLVRGWRVNRALTTTTGAFRRYADMPKEDVTPSRTYVNSVMEETYTPPKWNVRGGADQHLAYRSLT